MSWVPTESSVAPVGVYNYGEIATVSLPKYLKNTPIRSPSSGSRSPAVSTPTNNGNINPISPPH